MFGFFGEINDLGGADEGEIKGVEEEQEPFVFEIIERNLLEGLLVAVPGVGFEEGSCLANCRPDNF